IKSGIASQFFGSDITGAIAQLLYNNDTATVNNLPVKKIYPRYTSNDTVRLSIDSQLVHIPAFYENFVLSLPKNTKLFNTSRQLTALPWIKYAEPNFVTMPSSVPNDLDYSFQANLHPTATYPDGSIHAEGAWDIETGQSFIKVGVYDSGIDGTHSDLNGSKIAGGYDCVYGTSIITGTNNDLSGHGTACAGIIGGYRNNANGIAGIAGGDGTNPGCTLYDMRMLSAGVLNSAVSQAIIDGVDVYGLHIMNNSWSQPSPTFDIQLHDAVQYAAKNGVIFCASRGNYAINPITGTGVAGTYDNDYRWPACFQDEMVINVDVTSNKSNRLIDEIFTVK
ncbi:MAG: S8 family peptidase, partial [Bacteroidia bacterium]